MATPAAATEAIWVAGAELVARLLVAWCARRCPVVAGVETKLAAPKRAAVPAAGPFVKCLGSKDSSIRWLKPRLRQLPCFGS